MWSSWPASKQLHAIKFNIHIFLRSEKSTTHFVCFTQDDSFSAGLRFCEALGRRVDLLDNLALDSSICFFFFLYYYFLLNDTLLPYINTNCPRKIET